MKTTTLYRPVGLKELELIAASGWCAFPPRLDWQPIFYPVLNEAYAAQIAKEWNTGDAFSGYLGVVTKFEVNKEFCAQFEVQNVGAQMHDELWIPAERLVDFNQNIVGKIGIVQAFFGNGFEMPANTALRAELTKFKQ